MPRDNKTPLIQKIAKQAYMSFKGVSSSANGENNVFADTQSELISLVTAVRAADLKIAPRKTKASSGAAGLQSPPVTYMHICETEVFSMGVFLLRTGASIPLHDHPGMNGMLKVFYYFILFFVLHLLHLFFSLFYLCCVTNNEPGRKPQCSQRLYPTALTETCL